MKNRKKLMILGAGYSQIPLIEAAKRLGYYTIVTSIPGEYPGFSHGEECCYADISKPEEVLKKAEEIGIDGITTCCMDTGIRSVGLVCDKLSLNGLTYEAANRVSNKFLSKEAFLKNSVTCAQSYSVSSQGQLGELLSRMNIPLVLKAVDLMGSRGIYLARSKGEELKFYDQVMGETKQDYCLVEEYIEGLLFGAEGMIQNGKFVYLLPYGTEVYTGGSIATSLGHDVPFAFWEQYDVQIRTLLEKASKALGLDNSPFNCDLILKEDKVYLIEINGRAGASCLSESVGIYYGTDYYECICRQAMGEEVTPFFELRNKKPVPNRSKILTAPETGILKRAENKNVPCENLVDLSFNVSVGDRVRVYENGKDRIGQIIIKGNTRKDCEDYLKEVLDNIVIEVE